MGQILVSLFIEDNNLNVLDIFNFGEEGLCLDVAEVSHNQNVKLAPVPLNPVLLLLLLLGYYVDVEEQLADLVDEVKGGGY